VTIPSVASEHEQQGRKRECTTEEAAAFHVACLRDLRGEKTKLISGRFRHWASEAVANPRSLALNQSPRRLGTNLPAKDVFIPAGRGDERNGPRRVPPRLSVLQSCGVPRAAELGPKGGSGPSITNAYPMPAANGPRCSRAKFFLGVRDTIAYVSLRERRRHAPPPSITGASAGRL
jgi:hypothetical protein